MPDNKQIKSRTSKRNLTKSSKFPKWVIAIVLLLIAGTGLYLVYNSFAATPVRTVFCRAGNDSQCADSRHSIYTVRREVYVRNNYRCSYRTEFKLVSSGPKGKWYCLVRPV